MTKNHHNDVYNTAKTSQFTGTINAYLMISNQVGFKIIDYIKLVGDKQLWPEQLPLNPSHP